MGEVINVDDFTICSICRKRKAEFLCDMPIGRYKTMHLRKENGVTDYENSFRWFTHTCDRAICAECAIDMGGDIHICVKCMEEVIKKNDLFKVWKKAEGRKKH